MNPFSKSNCVGGLGEKNLISRIRGNFGNAMPPSPYGAGDDCALIEKNKLEKNIYATTDAVIYGRHFDDSASARAAGAKLFKRNASDIASMGGTPFAALTSSIFSKNLSLDWLDEFCEGLAQEATRFNTKLIGGDLAMVPENFFSMHLTLLGQSNTGALLRTGAHEGDCIYVTGTLGRSFESGHHLDFQPRIAQGQWLANINGVGACTDLSDGIASDIHNLLIQNNYCAFIEKSSVPLRKWGNNQEATLEQALSDGEDYELLFTFSGDTQAFERLYLDKFGEKVFKIGLIKKASSSSEENAIVLVDQLGKTIFKRSGFDHLAR